MHNYYALRNCMDIDYMLSIYDFSALLISLTTAEGSEWNLPEPWAVYDGFAYNVAKCHKSIQNLYFKIIG